MQREISEDLDDNKEEEQGENFRNDEAQSEKSVEASCETVEMEETSRGFEPTAALLIGGIILVLTGFSLVALTALTHILHPHMLFFVGGFGLFAAGIISIFLAWHRLS